MSRTKLDIGDMLVSIILITSQASKYIREVKIPSIVFAYEGLSGQHMSAHPRLSATWITGTKHNSSCNMLQLLHMKHQGASKTALKPLDQPVHFSMKNGLRSSQKVGVSFAQHRRCAPGSHAQPQELEDSQLVRASWQVLVWFHSERVCHTSLETVHETFLACFRKRY